MTVQGSVRRKVQSEGRQLLLSLSRPRHPSSGFLVWTRCCQPRPVRKWRGCALWLWCSWTGRYNVDMGSANVGTKGLRRSDRSYARSSHHQQGIRFALFGKHPAHRAYGSLACLKLCPRLFFGGAQHYGFAASRRCRQRLLGIGVGHGLCRDSYS